MVSMRLPAQRTTPQPNALFHADTPSTRAALVGAIHALQHKLLEFAAVCSEKQLEETYHRAIDKYFEMRVVPRYDLAGPNLHPCESPRLELLRERLRAYNSGATPTQFLAALLAACSVEDDLY